MKKKIIIGLSLFSLIFLVCGIYIITTTEESLSKLDNLIILHQVEILREQLLINIKRVQTDLSLKSTRYARKIDTVIGNVRDMEIMAETCFDCHHSEDVQERLSDLIDEIEKYANSLSRVLTIRANVARLEMEQENAFRIGEGLITKVNNMIAVTNINLEKKTQSVFSEIAKTKIILFLLVALGPFSIAVLGFLFIRGFSKPVSGLLKATRRLKGGDLDYKIEGLKDEFGEVAASFNEMSDSLKQNMHKIQESEKRYRTLFESAGDAIFILEGEGEDSWKIVSANQAAAEMHGYTVDELLGLNLIKDLDTADAAEDAPERFKRILNGEWIKIDISHHKKDGTEFPVEASAGLLEFMDHKYILAFDRDISERKKMEKAILQSKLDWEDTFNAITDMITIHDKDFNIIRANREAQKILGLPFLETTKAKCYDSYHGKDGPPEWCPSCKCLKTGVPASHEMFEPHLGIFIEIRAMPRFDSNNQLIGLIHVIRDITERKRVEEKLHRAEQMKIVGEWAAGLAHEIKNPLAGIKVSVEVLADEQKFSEEDRTVMSKLIGEINRIDTLLRSLLNFAKPPKPEFTSIDMNDVLDKTITFSLRHQSFSSDDPAKIKVLKDFDKDIPQTTADPMQLQQAFLNLLLNAIEASQEGGSVSVKTSYDAEANAVRVDISNTGKGIDRKLMGKIFQPFFTTKPKGTGLGLAITKRFVELQGGELSVENRTGGGAIFSISLPVKQVKVG